MSIGQSGAFLRTMKEHMVIEQEITRATNHLKTLREHEIGSDGYYEDLEAYDAALDEIEFLIELLEKTNE